MATFTTLELGHLDDPALTLTANVKAQLKLNQRWLNRWPRVLTTQQNLAALGFTTTPASMRRALTAKLRTATFAGLILGLLAPTCLSLIMPRTPDVYIRLTFITVLSAILLFDLPIWQAYRQLTTDAVYPALADYHLAPAALEPINQLIDRNIIKGPMPNESLTWTKSAWTIPWLFPKQVNAYQKLEPVADLALPPALVIGIRNAADTSGIDGRNPMSKGHDPITVELSYELPRLARLDQQTTLQTMAHLALIEQLWLQRGRYIDHTLMTAQWLDQTQLSVTTAELLLMTTPSQQTRPLLTVVTQPIRTNKNNGSLATANLTGTAALNMLEATTDSQPSAALKAKLETMITTYQNPLLKGQEV